MGRNELLLRVVSLSSRHGYIYPSRELGPAGVEGCYDYGPLGVELRRNILNEWWTEVVTSQEHIVGLENDVFQKTSPSIPSTSQYNVVNPAQRFVVSAHEDPDDGQGLGQESGSSICLRQALHNGIFSHYFNTLCLLNRRLPFGLAQIGPCFRNTQSQTDDAGKFIFSGLQTTELSMQFFSTPKTATLWFDTWQRDRLLWWRKFAGLPSEFTATDVKTKEHIQTAEIQYNFPWGVDTIERIANHGSVPVEQLQAQSEADMQGKDGRKSVVPHMIETVASLEAGMLAYLLDAHQEKQRADTKGKKVMREIFRLHLKLAPVKAIILPLRGTRELRELSDYLGKEFRKAGINVHCIVEMSPSLENYYTVFDEMGVPYTILLNENTLKTGVLRVRNRDTTLTQQLHITEVRKVVQRHLEAD